MAANCCSLSREKTIRLSQSPLNQSPLSQSPLNQSPLSQSPLNQSPLSQSPLNHHLLKVENCSECDTTGELLTGSRQTDRMSR